MLAFPKNNGLRPNYIFATAPRACWFGGQVTCVVGTLEVTVIMTVIVVLYTTFLRPWRIHIPSSILRFSTWLVHRERAAACCCFLKEEHDGHTEHTQER
jgi:hypothetical protein